MPVCPYPRLHVHKQRDIFMAGMDIRIVTSFSPSMWDDYVHRILPKNMELWPADWHVWTDDHSRILPGHWNVHCLAEDPEHEAFMENWNRILLKNNDLATAISEERFPTNYAKDAGTFCHKVFAMTNEEMRSCDWLVWLGADVEITEPITEDWLEKILLGDVVHLGRKDMRASETEFVAFRTGDMPARRFLDALRWIYGGVDLFNYAEWTDAHIIGRLAHIGGCMGCKVHNLSQDIPGLDVWPHTILGERMKHYKGNQKQELINA